VRRGVLAEKIKKEVENMCHIAALTSTLGTVNADILKMALEVIAQEEGIKVSDSVKDYYAKEFRDWKGSRVSALKTDGLPRGIGTAIVAGKLEFVGDSFGCSSAFDAMKQRIEQMYKKVALITALKRLEYDVSVHQGESILAIQGVKS
jgi:hypothetical protein